MKITVQITVQSDEGQAEAVREVACLERGPLHPETLGLSLAEARSILAGLEQTLVEQQAAEFIAQQRRCPQCGRERACKGHHQIVFRTPFGKLKLDSPQLYGCPCRSPGPGPKSVSPLAERLPERTSPELAYLDVGKRLATEAQAAQCFAFVSRYDAEPKGRRFEWLNAQGLQRNQAITFLSDGGDTVRELPRGFTPQAEYLLDWFHLSMRLTAMGQLAKGGGVSRITRT
jgi:hypothetical protein